MVTLTPETLGKGRKERICPLWPETAQVLARIVDGNAGPAAPILRHSCAVALLQAGVDITVIREPADAPIALAFRRAPSRDLG